MITVNKKLQTIASLINHANKVVDVGSDHALLAIYLLQNQKCQYVYNLDINIEPLQQGIKNCEKYQVIKKTTNLLSDGLTNIKENLSVDYIVVAGMGGNNMQNIIETIPINVQWNNLILSPNNNVDKLRQFLKSKHWKISYETVINENDAYYEIILVNKKKGLDIKDKLDVYFGPYNLQHQNQTFKALHQSRINHIKDKHLDELNAKYQKELKLLYAIFK